MQMTGREIVSLMQFYSIPEAEINRLILKHCPQQMNQMTMGSEILPDETVYRILAELHQDETNANSKNDDGIMEMLLYLEATPPFNVKFTMDDIMKICAWLNELVMYRSTKESSD